MDLDTCNAVADASDATLRSLADLIAASRSEEQMVYRETELDEVWRLLATQRDAGGPAAAQIAARMAVVHDVHDMVSVAAGSTVAAAAAARLRGLAD